MAVIICSLAKIVIISVNNNIQGPCEQSYTFDTPFLITLRFIFIPYSYSHAPCEVTPFKLETVVLHLIVMQVCSNLLSLLLEILLGSYLEGVK